MKTLLLSSLLLLTGSVALSAQALATWDFESGSLPLAGATTIPASVLPASAQVTVAINSGVQSPPAPNAGDKSLASYFFPAAGTGYFQVELLCPTGDCDFSGIEAVLYKSSGAPTSVRVEYSLLPVFASPTIVGTYPVNATGSTSLNIPVNALQVNRITVRLYGLGATSNFGTLYLGGISLNGSVSTAPLPATLTSFRAKPAGNEVYVQWSTASEVGVESFVVEAAYGLGEEFTPVQKTTPKGDERTGANYELTLPASRSTIYVRLRTIDHDGLSALSEVVSVAPFGKTGWKIALSESHLRLSADEEGEYRIVGTQGEVVANGRVQANEQMSIDCSSLVAGLYVFHLNGRSQRLFVAR